MTSWPCGKAPGHKQRLAAQVWLNHPVNNFGWERIKTDAAGAQTVRSFYRKEVL